MKKKDIINHIGLVLDASDSMRRHKTALVSVADGLIRQLATRSEELGQETRVSVYTFNYQVENVIFDKDVLRLPSIAEHYDVSGMTALRDATGLAIDDLKQTAQMYGDHGFLVYVLTDGDENASRRVSSAELRRTLVTLPENWTLAALVPDENGRRLAIAQGFLEGNVDTWDTQSTGGLLRAGSTISRATETYMTRRSTGTRGYSNLFGTGADKVNTATVQTALDPVDPSLYSLTHVVDDVMISEFAERFFGRYQIGKSFYELTVRVKIQPQKQIAIMNKKTKQVYTGAAARDVIGLPNHEVSVKPDFNPDYTIFVQSTSVNRKLLRGTTLLQFH